MLFETHAALSLSSTVDGAHELLHAPRGPDLRNLIPNLSELEERVPGV